MLKAWYNPWLFSSFHYHTVRLLPPYIYAPHRGNLIFFFFFSKQFAHLSMTSHQNKIQSPHYVLYAVYDLTLIMLLTLSSTIPLLVHCILDNSVPAVYGICQVHAHLKKCLCLVLSVLRIFTALQIYMTCSLTSFRPLLTYYLIRSLSQLPYKKQFSILSPLAIIWYTVYFS